MPKFCSSCGASVPDTARFCNKCGTRIVPTAPAESPSAVPPPSDPSRSYEPSGSRYGSAPSSPPLQYNPPPASSAGTGLQPNVAGMLCYVLGLITGIIFLVIHPYNQDRFVRFHAFQSIFLHVAFIVLMIVLGVVGAILPWGLDLVVWLARMVVWLGGVAAWIYMMVKAYNNEKYKLPIVGDIAEQQAGR